MKGTPYSSSRSEMNFLQGPESIAKNTKSIDCSCGDGVLVDALGVRHDAVADRVVDALVIIDLQRRLGELIDRCRAGRSKCVVRV